MDCDITPAFPDGSDSISFATSLIADITRLVAV
jgi:hypothetical protein